MGDLLGSPRVASLFRHFFSPFLAEHVLSLPSKFGSGNFGADFDPHRGAENSPKDPLLGADDTNPTPPALLDFDLRFGRYGLFRGTGSAESECRASGMYIFLGDKLSDAIIPTLIHRIPSELRS